MTTNLKQLKWKKLAFKKANATYDLAKITSGAVDPVSQSFWPDDAPSYRVYQGDVAVKGAAEFGGDDAEEDGTAFVITGDLKVDGPLIVFQGDCNAIFVVMGSVTCSDCLVAEDGALVVAGSFKSAGTLATRLTQMGVLSVSGDASAANWLEASGQGLVRFARGVEARLSYVGSKTFNRSEGSSEIDFTTASPAELAVSNNLPWSIKEAMIAGAQIVVTSGSRQ